MNIKKASARAMQVLLLVMGSGLAINATAAETKATTKAVPHIKVEDLVKLRGARNLKISPDGKHLSAVLRHEKEDLLAILDSANLKPVGMFRVRGVRRNVGTVYWVNNQRVIYTVTESSAWNKHQYDVGEIYGVNVDGKKHKRIFGYQAGEESTGTNLRKKKADYGNNEILDLLPDDDKHILLAFYPWYIVNNRWRSNPNVNPVIYKLDVYSGRKKKVGNLSMPYADGITDNNGDVRFSIGVDDNNDQIISYKNKAADDWKVWSPKSSANINNIYPQSFTADNQNVYITANVGDGTRALYSLNLKDQSIEKVVHNEKVDISLFIRDFVDDRIVGVATQLGLPAYDYLDLKNPTVKLHRSMLATFEGNDVRFTSSTKDHNKVVVYVFSDTNSGEYYLYDRQKKTVAYLSASRDWLDPQAMVMTEPMTIKTRDGADIYGYLTLPKHQSKNLPLVVFPHGGPHGVRDWWGFNWEVQLLANRGYAVLQVNYRGSDGFGTAFEAIGKGKWGGLMQDDLTDATQMMIDSGVADAKRICMYGASYGAYASLMGAVREPDMYRCVIGSAGVYNLPMMFKEGDIAERKRGLVYLKEVLGDNLADQKKRSPTFNVDKIKAEVLLIHGGQDERAPMEQAESLKDAFDAIGKKYQWLEIGNEAHGYYDEANRLTVYNKILAFLDQHIGQ